MKRFLIVNTMILALAATSAFAASNTHKATSRGPKPAATQAATGTAAKPASTTTTKKKRHRKHKAVAKSATDMKGGATKKN